MRLRSAAWTGILLLSLLVSSCSRSTPGNTPSSEAQPKPDTTAQSSPAPAAGGKSEAAPAQQNAPTTQPERPQTAQQEAPAVTPPPPPPAVVMPAGTVLAVRLNTALGSTSSKTGDKFTASVAQLVSSHGQVAIPAGSTASGTVEQAQQGGKVKGSSSLSLRLTSLTVKGVLYPISTASFVEQGKGKGSRTAKFGAGGAAAGAVIGGIAGGGKGAAIGAVAGGGTGVAGSAFTGNNELSIPAETVLQFKLSQPLRLNPESRSPSSDSPQQ
jgi:hypothetical protein